MKFKKENETITDRKSCPFCKCWDDRFTYISNGEKGIGQHQCGKCKRAFKEYYSGDIIVREVKYNKEWEQ
jgi:hypothetical protein